MLRTVNYLNAINTLRLSSTKAVKKQNVNKYTNTINLPKTKFPSRLSSSKREEVERNIIEGQFANSYTYQEHHNDEPAFILHDGPPYANGDLHMGHAVNKILKDITLRHNVAKGRKVNYIPGWDCHGLPIELKATIDSKTAEPRDIRKKCRKFANDAVFRQKDEFRSWGIFADWLNSENIYLTCDPKFIQGQLQMFYSFLSNDLVYRDLKPVYWSPSSRTALAEAELQYDENFISPSVVVRFRFDKIPESISNYRRIYALVWTTTPWTLPSNQAVCYNSDLEYCLVRFLDNKFDNDSHHLLATNLISNFEQLTGIQLEVVQKISGEQLKGSTYFHPINAEQESLPFLSASHVLDTKGTGLVHTAPAHGLDDFLVCLEQKIPILCYVDEEGLYTKEAPEFLHRKPVMNEGNDLVLQHIASDVIFSGKFSHSYPIDWRTKKPVIIRASEQWFMNTERLKTSALDEINQIEVYPKINSEVNKNALMMQIKKRPYWCISRQRVWGTPIPVFYEKKSGKIVINRKIIDHICNEVQKEGNIDFWWEKSVEQLLPSALLSELQLSSDDLIKGGDIFDIWFDSGSSWSSVLNGGKIADLYLEGYDQFTGWFQSSLLTSIASKNRSPYKSLFVHGFTVDEKGHKMSKSIGNVILPENIVKKFGTDCLRCWVASHATQHASIAVSDQLLQQTSENLNKIRQTLRFLNGAIGKRTENDAEKFDRIFLNKFLLNSLFEFHNEIQNCYDSYEYHRVTANIQNFVVNDISATYLHLIKDRLYCGSEEDIQSIRFTLSKCYETLCKVLWPIVPFLVEESWSYYDCENAFHKQRIIPNAEWKDEKVKDVHEAAMMVKRQINRKVNDVNSWMLSVRIGCAGASDMAKLDSLKPQLNEKLDNSELCEILQVSNVTLDANMEDGVEIKILNSVLCPRCRRFPVVSEESICNRCTKVLQQKQNHAELLRQ